MQDSQGPIADRTIEHLGPMDLGIMRLRRLLMDAARGIPEGREPKAASVPEAYAVGFIAYDWTINRQPRP